MFNFNYALRQQIDPKLAIRFILDYSSERLESTLRSDWVSYGLRIGNLGDKVRPSSVLNVVTTRDNIVCPEGETIDEDGKLRLFCILLAGYRYGLAAEIFQGDYKIEILKRINLVAKNEPISLKLDITVGEVQGYNSWINNLDFRAMVAALDMYWTKFPDALYAQLRVCTLNSRYKDCSSISELRHLSQLTSLPIGKALEYVFFSRVKDEVVSIGRPGEEFDREDSYFSYMRELRLSKKSPYSSSANVHLHNWISIFGALLGSERSYNARLVSEDGILSALNLAIFSAYAFKRYASGHLVFGGEDIAQEAKARAHAYEGIDRRDVPQFAEYSPMGVFTKIEDCKAVVPQTIITFFAHAISKFNTPRPGTIGAYLQKALPQ